MAPKKKLTKKEKARIEAERNEALRIEMEKERQRLLEEEKERKMQERAEAERKHKQQIKENKIRRIQLAESCSHFGKIKTEINEILSDMRKQREWQRYMRCNGLPNAYDSGDLRKYIHTWRLKINEYNQDERNWLLITNERTILTQNRTIPNMTINHLKLQQPNLGDLYSVRVKEVLGILNEIDEAILDVDSLSESIRTDLKELKFEFRTILSSYIDEFSYKILSNIDRDMKIEGELIATHLYESDVFKAQLWTLRDIPQPQLNPKEIERAERAHTEIEFTALELSLSLPPIIKCNKSAVEAIWLSYDHFSDYSPSFEIPHYTQLYKGLDINTASRKEWKKRKEMLKIALEEASKKPIIEKPAEGSLTNPDESKEPGIIDVDKIYTEYEDEINKDIRKQKGPDGLNLKKFDINLRSHRIVAGIYCIEYLEQPNQDTKTNCRTFLRTVTHPNNLKRKGFHQPYKPPEPVAAGVRRLPEEIEAELKQVEANLDKLASITIKLPDDVMWLEPPTVCRWETPEETKLSEELEKLNSNQIEKSATKKIKSTIKSSKCVNDFDLLNMPSKIDLYSLFQEFVVPRLPNGYTMKMRRPNSTRRNSSLKSSRRSLIAADFEPNIQNSMQLTNSPRPLYPKVMVNRNLQLLTKNDEDTEQISPHNILSPNTESDKSPKIYMFSKLLEDLDELSQLQTPFVEKQMEEISETLSVLSNPAEDDQEPEMEFGLSFPWSIKKEEIVEKADDTESESEESATEESVEHVSSADNNTIRKEAGKWTTRDIHDSKFNEEKLAIQFKTGRLGYFGLAISWYSNIPFQTWELKPDTKTGGAIFNLTGSIISIELTVVPEGYIFNSFQGGTSSIVQQAVGQTTTLREFRNVLTRAAINLFPDQDAFCYTEGTGEKNPIMESHLYTCMGSLALTHNFTWSRWNLLSGRRSCILLMREMIENRKLPYNSTLHVTPLKACLVDCTDVSSSFNSTGIEGMEFYADLHTLSQAHSQPISLEKQAKMNPLLRENVIQLLMETRPLSFS